MKSLKNKVLEALEVLKNDRSENNKMFLKTMVGYMTFIDGDYKYVIDDRFRTMKVYQRDMNIDESDYVLTDEYIDSLEGCIFLM